MVTIMQPSVVVNARGEQRILDLAERTARLKAPADVEEEPRPVRIRQG
jgi:hypothetical protein